VRGNSLLNYLILVIAGAVAGSAATYLLTARDGSPPADAPLARSGQQAFFSPLRDALADQGLDLEPGLPPGYQAPPDRLIDGMPHRGDAPAVWWAEPARSRGLMQMNAEVSAAVEALGGRVLAGWEDSRRLAPQGGDRTPTPPGSSLWLGVEAPGDDRFVICLVSPS